MSFAVAVLIVALVASIGVAVRCLMLARSRGRELERCRSLADRADERRVEVVDTVDTVGRSVPALEGALNSVAEAVIVTDSQGGVAFSNRFADALLTATDERALVRDAVLDLLGEAANGQTSSREIALFGPPASTFVIAAHPWKDAGGALLGSVALVEEVSERRRLDQLRRDFVANISHELKTPVGAVGLLADTLQREVEVGDDATDVEVVRRLVGRISVEMSRLSATIDDLLVLSRAEAGDELALDEFSSADVVRDASTRLGAAAEAKSIDLRVNVIDDVSIIGDRRQLVSALTNLVDNALKYSAAGQSVTITSQRCREGLRVEVADEGVGIPARDLARVFERFYRVDRGRSRDTGGTGLGLAIVRHIVANHGGQVDVQSHEGRGSVFAITLPVPEEDENR